MKTLLVALALFAPNAFAVEGDLVLPGARFQANFSHYSCNDLETGSIDLPASLQGTGLQFEKLQGDGMIINFLVTANYQSNGQTCHYSAMLMRGSHSAMNKTDSKSFSEDAATDCSAGKAVLDTLTTKMTYTNTTSPIRFIGLRMPITDGATICGEGAKTFKVVFERDRSVNLSL